MMHTARVAPPSEILVLQAAMNAIAVHLREKAVSKMLGDDDPRWLGPPLALTAV